MPEPGPICFLSDFGVRDAYVGVVEGVIASISPHARILHLTHGVPPQDVRHASYQLYAALPHLPTGAIVLAVVDPGVGTSRRGLVVETAKHFYVAPDNGILGAALALDPPRRAHVLEDARYRLPTVSRTFHGRDVFGPAAAFLARGEPAGHLGPAIKARTLVHAPVEPTDGPAGEIWTFDHFGNAISTVRGSAQPDGDVEVGGRTIPRRRFYGEVARGEPLALVGSTGQVEISVREGSARERLGLEEGMTVRVVPRRDDPPS
ncbi:MAG: S-adenosyl-l-methionine hydroxide adenosyltransferase family protein [Sandaracinaceae bacterium]